MTTAIIREIVNTSIDSDIVTGSAFSMEYMTLIVPLIPILIPNTLIPASE